MAGNAAREKEQEPLSCAGDSNECCKWESAFDFRRSDQENSDRASVGGKTI